MKLPQLAIENDKFILILVEAYYTADVDDKYRDVIAAVNAAKSDLPSDIFSIDVSRFNPLDVVILQLALVSETSSYSTLKKTAADLKDQLKTINGVREVEIHATPEPQINIALNIRKMTAQNIALNQVMRILQSTNANIPAGEIKAGNKSFTLKTSGSYKTLSDIQNTVISATNGHLIHLKDIATVTRGYEDLRYIGRFNGQRAIFVSVTQKEGDNVLDIDHTLTTITADVIEGANTATITQAIIKQLNAYSFPTGYTYHVGGEYETQQESFGSMGQVLVVALLGIFAVLVLQFKSFKQPFVVFSAIPLAFTGSIFTLFLMGYSFSFFAFVGFTSLIGIVINNAIILIDYANQRISEGTDLLTAIQQASETRFTPIILTTLTTIVGLLPLTLTGSNLWAPLGWTIIGGMISSTILTLVIVPVLLKWFSDTSAVSS